MTSFAATTKHQQPTNYYYNNDDNNNNNVIILCILQLGFSVYYRCILLCKTVALSLSSSPRAFAEWDHFLFGIENVQFDWSNVIFMFPLRCNRVIKCFCFLLVCQFRHRVGFYISLFNSNGFYTFSAGSLFAFISAILCNSFSSTLLPKVPRQKVYEWMIYALHHRYLYTVSAFAVYLLASHNCPNFFPCAYVVIYLFIVYLKKTGK